jgi:hypothetical protein
MRRPGTRDLDPTERITTQEAAELVGQAAPRYLSHSGRRCGMLLSAMTGKRGLGASVSRLRGRHLGRWIVVCLAILVLVLAACTPAPTSTPTESPSPTPLSTATPTTRSATETPVATDTPQVTETPTEEPSTSTPTPPEQPPTSRPTPTSAPPTEPTATPTPQATIHVFKANVDIAGPGETITLTWRWSGADVATIYHLMDTGQLGELHWEVEPTGSLQYTIAAERRNHDAFMLFLNDEREGVVAQDTLQIPVRCPDEWFFRPAPGICPASPVTVTDGAEQHFERGVMLWNRAEGRIYGLFEEPYPPWSAYTDE